MGRSSIGDVRSGGGASCKRVERASVVLYTDHQRVRVGCHGNLNVGSFVDPPMFRNVESQFLNGKLYLEKSGGRPVLPLSEILHGVEN